MAWPEVITNTFPEFLATHADLINKPDESVLFRGVSNKAWHLTPSVARALGDPALTPANRIEIERRSIAEFRHAAPQHHSAADIALIGDIFHCWALMQHYSAPTRLLDWTSSPFIALYFAVSGDPGNDGAVWTVNRHALESAVAALGGDCVLPDVNDREATFLQCCDSDAIHFQRPDVSNQRMFAQKGWFSIARRQMCHHDEVIERLLLRHGDATSLRKFVIPSAAKVNMLRALGMFNISAVHLFPGPDGYGRHISEIVRFLVHEKVS